jgi:signal transduction histidine kinase
MGLRLRLILVITVPLVLVLGVYGLFRLRAEQAELLLDNQRLMGVAAKAIQSSVENAIRDRQIADVRRLLTEIIESQEQIDRVRVFNGKLETMLVSNPLSIGEQIPEDPLRRVLQYGLPEWFYQRRGTQQVLYYIVPMRGDGNAVTGAIEIVQLASGVEERAQAAALDVAIRLGTVLISVALLTGLILQREVLNPLRRLMDGIRRVGQGRPGPPLRVERRDELGRVAEAFNTMAGQLDSARRKLLEESERALDLEGQLRHAQTLAVAGRLATALAHEVGTPLNIISGRAEVVQNSLDRNDPLREELGVIVDQIDRISGIIRSLLDTVRPGKPEVERVDLGAVVDRLMPLLRHATRSRGASLEMGPALRLPPVLADPNQVQQLVINLVVNAAEAVAEDGEIGIHLEPAEVEGRPGVRLAVRDTGQGIPAELRARVFDAFFTTKPPGRGTGLGLTICRDIVKEHGGLIRIDDHPGGGTVVSVWMPAAEGHA